MPASAGSALTVGAIDQKDAKASYSNHGNVLKIYAPGSRYVRVCEGICVCVWACPGDGAWEVVDMIWLAGRMDNDLGFGGGEL